MKRRQVSWSNGGDGLWDSACVRIARFDGFRMLNREGKDFLK